MPIPDEERAVVPIPPALVVPEPETLVPVTGIGPEELTRIRHEISEQAAANARLSIERVKRQLSEQETISKQAHAATVQAQIRLKSLETYSKGLQDQLLKTRADLSASRQQRHAELRAATQRENALKLAVSAAESAAARRYAAPVVAAPESNPLRKWFIVVCGCLVAAMAMIVWTRLAAPSATAQASAAPENAPSATPQTTLPVSYAAASVPPKISAVHDAAGAANSSLMSHADLSSVLESLDDALSNFKGRDPDEILRKVHKENAARGIEVCSFEWNGGQVSLVFGRNGNTDPEAAILRCAAAVKQSAGK